MTKWLVLALVLAGAVGGGVWFALQPRAVADHAVSFGACVRGPGDQPVMDFVVTKVAVDSTTKQDQVSRRCVSATEVVTVSPTIARSRPSELHVDGEMRLSLAAPKDGDCSGGTASVALGHLPDGHYSVRGGLILEFDVPLGKKPICSFDPPTEQ